MPDPTMTEKIVLWARGEVGKTHGDWECWHLVDAALTQAGAKSSTTSGKDDNYVWGDPIDLKDVGPGDIPQFRDFDLTMQTRTDFSTTTGAKGTEGSEPQVKKRGHHSAIVDAILGPGQLRIIEIHVKPAPVVVSRNVIYTRTTTLPPTVTHGEYSDDKGRLHKGATITKTLLVTVSGKIWAYRAKPKKH
jgi:hypothetical protein